MNVVRKFFFKNGDFQPPYMYMALYMILILSTTILGHTNKIPRDYALSCITIFSGAMVTYVGLYNWNEKNKMENKNE